MSCQAGIWNFDGKPINREFLARLGASIDQYGPDRADELGRGGPGEYVNGNVAMIYRAYSTNKESRLERQPYVTRDKESGVVRNVMTWDGRLDNRFELMSILGSDLAMNHPGERTDVAIVMAAWERWGTDCFKKLIGDFSLAVWNQQNSLLTLAKDFVGVRYLYYEVLPEGVRGGARSDPELGDADPPSGPCVWWCSRLEPLILLSGRQYQLNEEYIAGYFAFHPANHLTPYIGVHALPASHYAQIRPSTSAAQLTLTPRTRAGLRRWFTQRSSGPVPSSEGPASSTEVSRNGHSPSPSLESPVVGHSSFCVTLTKYWEFDPDKRITYKSDAEYEEHFRHVFFQSVKRRLRADAPVVAGLSGGRDSSAIICVADELIAKGEVETPRLDTFSSYDEEEPFGNDKPYLTIVEQKRGRVGHHFGHGKSDSGSLATCSALAITPKRLRPLSLDCFSAHPGADQGSEEGVRKRMEFMKNNGYRIILAGTGGDEVTGGIPYYISELADLFVEGHFIRLLKQFSTWSLALKQPWASIVWNTSKNFQSEFLRRVFWDRKDVWPWIAKSFLDHWSGTFRRRTNGFTATKGLPSFRTNVAVVIGVSWQLASVAKLHRRRPGWNYYDRGFPFLDRDFIEFMMAVPRDQVLRPGQYRSLMRRGLTNIVPTEILNRTRKAFAARRPVLQIEEISSDIRALLAHPVCEEFCWVNSAVYLKNLDEFIAGKNDFVIPIRKTIKLEMLVRGLAERRLLRDPCGQPEASGSVLQGVA